MFALGNLASDPENLDVVMKGGCLKPIVSFAFPGDYNVQFQAVAALRGLAVNPEVRLEITRAGALDPLILAAAVDNIEVQRETAAALANISLNEENKVQIARSGCLPALIQLAQADDRERERYAVMTLANVAEMVEGRTQRRMLEEGSIKALQKLASSLKLIFDVSVLVHSRYLHLSETRIKIFYKLVVCNRWYPS